MNTKTATKRIPKFLSGEGEMAARIRDFDWSRTSLGEPEYWPESLKSVIGLMLANRFPMLLWWGEDYIQFYNDPYIPIPGLKHPRALGQTGRECWQEIWDVIGPLVDTPFKGGPASWMDDILLKLNRNNFVEETHFIIAYSPMPDANAPNGIGGVLATVNEITEEIFGKRQMDSLRKLGNSISSTLSVDDVYAQATAVLQENSFDIPFALVHKIDNEGSHATLTASAGIEIDHFNFQKEISIHDPGSDWQIFAKAVHENAILVSENPGSWGELPRGAWDIPPNYFAHLPIQAGKRSHPVAVVTIAMNPYRKFDDSYKNFLHLIADQISFGVSNAIAYEEEKKRAKMLEELDRAKTIFFSNISHEFRTPLTLMLGTIEESLKDPHTNPSNTERMTVAHRNAMRLLRLVNSLLDFSRIESGRQQANYEITNIASLTENLAGNFRSVLEKAGLKFEVNVDPAIPLVYLDKQMWEKIVFNLLSNAFKYTLKGSIRVSVSSKEGHAILQVKDTGIGIPERELPRMFERFHRVENAMGRTYEGTGIGLSLTKELVQLHGGIISVESVEGSGSTFTVSIPFGKEHLPSTKVSETEKGSGNPISEIFIEEAMSLIPTIAPLSKNGNGRSSLVLVVDDNADMRQHIKSLLEKHYTVVTAANGKEALEQIETRKPVLVLSDIMMPVMDGIALLREIKNNRQHSHIPVILLTARAGEESKMEGFEMGADDYLVKPFSSNELLSRVRAQISISEKRSEAENRLREFLMQAPAAIAVVEGPDYVFSVCNSLYEKMFSRPGKKLLGLAMKQVLPEAEDQTMFSLFDKVNSTGETYVGHELPINVKDDGKVRTGYYDLVIHPIKDSCGKVTNLMLHAVDATAHVQARKKIESSERKFRDVLMRSPSIFLILQGADMIITFANEPLLTSWGKKPDIIGKPMLEVLPELKDQPFPRLLRQVYNTGEVQNGKEEKAVIFRNGIASEVYYNYVYQPIFETDGTISGITVMANDITEQVLARKKIERGAAELEQVVLERTAELKSSLDILSHAEESVNMGSWQTNLTNNKIVWSDNLYKLLGFQPNEVEPTFENFLQVVHPDDRDRVIKSNRRAVEERTPGEDVFRIITKGGDLKYVKSVGSKLFVGDDEIFIGTTQDVTELIKASEQIREKNSELESAHSFLQQVIDSSVEFISVLDTDLNYITVNRRLEESLGLGRESLKGRNLFEINPRVKDTIQHECIRKALSGTVAYLDKRQSIAMPDYFIDTYFVPLRIDNKIEGVIIMARDVTDIARSEAILEQKNIELERINRELASFTYIASHDLQEPLRKIQTFTHLIKGSENLQHAVDKYLDKIQFSAERMSSMISSVLAYSKLSQTSDEAVLTDLNKILENVKSDFELLIEEKKATVDSDRLPTIMAVPVSMQQLFSNLISNSLKFSEKPPVIKITHRIVTGAEVRTDTRPDLKKKFVEITFRDNGIGFEPEYSDQIFKLFQRLHGKTQYSGTGVGLSIVARIVERHNGFIRADSEKNKGATFTIWLRA